MLLAKAQAGANWWEISLTTIIRLKTRLWKLYSYCFASSWLITWQDKKSTKKSTSSSSMIHLSGTVSWWLSFGTDGFTSIKMKTLTLQKTCIALTLPKTLLNKNCWDTIFTRFTTVMTKRRCWLFIWFFSLRQMRLYWITTEKVCKHTGTI